MIKLINMSKRQRVFGTRSLPFNIYFWLFFSLAFSLVACKSQDTASSAPNVLLSKTAFDSNFNAQTARALSSDDLTQIYPQAQWAQLFERVRFEEQNAKMTMAVEYPKGSVGPHQGGAQFVINLPPKNTYTLTYSLKFKEGFDFRLGGKLPGLTSGGEKWTGGTRPLNGEGFSARLMWREKGLAELYLYYMDMQGKWGDSITFDDYYFVPGKWYNITQTITINEPGKNNAQIMIWINDKLVLNKQNFRLRVDDKPKIDSLYFSTFHGGNQPKWGPKVDSTAYFGDFIVR
jgi:hypothetical protein